jgi:hypothetical protein
VSAKSKFKNSFFAISLVLLTVVGAHAGEVKSPSPLGSVKYLGSADEQMSFIMSYENESNEKYVITIVDADGIVLFQGIFSEKKFLKTFKVPSDAGNVTFSVSSYKNRSEKKFVVSTERRIYEEVVVSKPVVKP